MRRSVSIVVAVAAVAATSLVTSRVTKADGSAIGSPMRGFAAANMVARTYSAAEAEAVARQFDVISAHVPTFRSHIGAMKAANPRLVLLAYLNGAFAQRTQGTAYPDSWYLRDASGAKVTSSVWGLYLMNPREGSWVDERVRACTAAIAASGYDGCFVDNLGSFEIEGGTLTAAPIDSATGRPWTVADWTAAMSNVAGRMKAGIGDRQLVANGLQSGPRYFAAAAPSSSLVGPADGALAEAWLRAAHAPASSYRSEASWLRDVDMIVDAEARGKAAHVMTKLWSAATATQRDAWHKFALASFLLGAGPRSAFSFVPDAGDATPLHPWDRVDVGTPLGPYGKRDSVYVREFTGGMAVVNPETTTVTYDLRGTYTTLDGRTVTTLVLGPHSGEVLTAPVDLSSVTRLAGADRIETAIAVARSEFAPGTAPGAVIARADEFADGLAGTPLAASIGGPLLLTGAQALDPRALAELRRAVRPGATVHVLGGVRAVGSAVDTALAAAGFAVERHGGIDRYETSIAIADRIPNPEVVLVSTGVSFPDALVAGAASASSRGVVLLTEGGILRSSLLTYLARHVGAAVTAVGGPAAAALPSATRLVGATRYDTAALVARTFTPTATEVAIASGTDFPDALVGGAHAARRGAALLLTDRSLPAATASAITAGGASRALVYGGPAVIPDSVLVAVARALAG